MGDETASGQKKLIRTGILCYFYCQFTLLLELQFVSFYHAVLRVRGSYRGEWLFHARDIFPWPHEGFYSYHRLANDSSHPVLWVILLWYALLALPLLFYFPYLVLKGTKQGNNRLRHNGVLGGCLLIVCQWVLMAITIVTETFGYPWNEVRWKFTPQLSGGVASLLAMIFLIVAGDIIHIQFKEESLKEQSKEQAIFSELKQLRTSSETWRIQQLLEDLTSLPHLSRNTRHLLRYFQSHPDPEIRVTTDTLLLKEKKIPTE